MNCGVQVKLLRDDAQMPTKANPTDMGYDLYCVEDDEFVMDRQYGKMCYELMPGKSHIFHTGLSMAIEDGFGCVLWDRSGMGAKRNIHRLAGVIDNSYRGSWLVSLINLSQSVQRIYAGDRIVQAVFTPCVIANMQEVSELDETARGSGGFGSTGS